MSLASNLCNFRKENNFSQEKLAEMLDVNCQTIANWESGITMPNSDQLLKLSKIFNTSIDELTYNEDYIFDRKNKNQTIKKDKNVNTQYKQAMIQSFISSALFFISSIMWFVQYYLIKEPARLTLGFVFIGIAFLWIGIAFMYKKKNKNEKHM